MVLENQIEILQGKNWYKQDFHLLPLSKGDTGFYLRICFTTWSSLEMYLHWNSALLKSVQLFFLSSKQCIIMTDMFSLHKLYITHSSSSCLMATGDFHSSYDSLCSANWVENRRLLGNNGAAARDAPLKLFSRALLENMLSNHKILPLVIIFKPSSHAGIQAENAVFFEKKKFSSGFAFAKH